MNLTDILKNLSEYSPYVSIPLIFIFFILKLPKLYDALTYITSRKIRNMEESLGSEILDDDIKEINKELINNQYFIQSTGIKTNSLYERKALIQLYRKSKGQISLTQIKLSFMYLKFNGKELVVNLTKVDNFIKWFFLIFGVFSGVVFISHIFIFLDFILSTKITELVTLEAFEKIYFIMLLCVLSFSFMMSSSKSFLEIRSAEDIKNYLERIKDIEKSESLIYNYQRVNILPIPYK